MSSQSSDRAIICFESEQLRAAYGELAASHRTEDRLLHKKIEAAIETLKQRPAKGDTIPHYLIPKEYRQRYGDEGTYLVYRLSAALRLTYLLIGNDRARRVILIEWMTHGEYEKRFGYRKT
jgi:hypothetical protein